MANLARSIFLTLILLTLVLPAVSVVASPLSVGPVRYFAPTGHTVTGDFLFAFDRLGGLDRFGFPRTEAFVEGGRTVQYFQRAVFELFPEHSGTPYLVQFRLLGYSAEREGGLAWTKITSAPVGARFFSETGHSVGSPFLEYYNARGGLYSFGYPISEPYERDGRLVQYFQRARMERHPDAPSGYSVQLGLLGDELIEREWSKGDARLGPVPVPESAKTPEYIWGEGQIIVSSTEAGRYNAQIAIDRINGQIVKPGGSLDFDEVAKSWDGREDLVYLVSKATDCEGGLITMRGGGVCYVSTALWRAWMQAGLETMLRVSHSGLLDDFGAGYDAANTLIVRNDSDATIRVESTLVGKEMTVRLIANRPMDRQVTIRGPFEQGGGSFLVYQDVIRAGGGKKTRTFDSFYCW